MPIPLQTGAPTLIPNFDQPTVNNGVTSLSNASSVLVLEPRVNATGTIVLGGSVATGNTLAVTLTQNQILGDTATYTYTALASDTLFAMAEGVASLINADAVVAQYFGYYAVSNEGTIVVNWPGPCGNYGTISVAATGSITNTLTPAGGVMTGGSGPVIPVANFTAQYNGSTLTFWYGKPKAIDASLIATMISQTPSTVVGNFV